MADPTKHPRVSPIAAGLACRCPRCGRGRLFDGYLTVAARCSACGLDLSKADSGDGPAVFIIFILGFLVAQHIMVSPDDLSRLNVSFFTMNGLISLVIFVATMFSL